MSGVCSEEGTKNDTFALGRRKYGSQMRPGLCVRVHVVIATFLGARRSDLLF
jgi:hypothetical protein